jgi:hypothetical protein
MTLSTFLRSHREEIINRCRAKTADRSAVPLITSEMDDGVPMFLDQLNEELLHGKSQAGEISNTARKRGHDQLLQELTISQVVHGYGDVCQSVTDLAVELRSPISTDDFRTLNRCLDYAIAAAVTEYAGKQASARDGHLTDLQILTERAIAAFDALRSGEVGISENTGKLIDSSLRAIRDIARRQHAANTQRSRESEPS